MGYPVVVGYSPTSNGLSPPIVMVVGSTVGIVTGAAPNSGGFCSCFFGTRYQCA